MKLICFLFGHKFITKEFSGRTTVDVDSWLGLRTTHYYTWRELPWCPRCGAPNLAVKKKEEYTTGESESN